MMPAWRDRRRSTAAGSLLAIVTALAAMPAIAHADDGRALLEIGRFSNGAPTSVDPGSLLSGLDDNEGAGGRFGVRANARDVAHTLTFTPPADTVIDSSRVWPSLHVAGWPALGTWGEITSSWGNWNVWGNPGEVRLDGLWAQGGSAVNAGSPGPLSATVRQQSYGDGPVTPAYFLTDKLDVALTDASVPQIDAQPDPDAPLGAARPSGWYTGASAPLTMTVRDRGLGVRALLVREGTAVHRYTPAGAPAPCATKDPDPALLGGVS
jgi:hypothetical protein